MEGGGKRNEEGAGGKRVLSRATLGCSSSYCGLQLGSQPGGGGGETESAELAWGGY